MSSQIISQVSQILRGCKHSKTEEQYICLEESCIKNQELKLDCLKCLEQNHPHHECIEHIENIINEGQENQKTFAYNIDQYLKFCSELKAQLEQNQEEMKRKLNQWLDTQIKILGDQIEIYQSVLNEQRLKISQIQFSKSQLQNIIEFKHLDNVSYTLQNLQIQKALQQNEAVFTQFFNVQFERISKNYKCDEIQTDNLPKIQTKYKTPKIIQFEKCTEVGCSNIDKNRFCSEKTCLQNQNLNLECPQCQVLKHCTENTFQTHKKYFLSAHELWEQQDRNIDKLDEFCQQKGQEIEQQSQQLQQMIIDCQKINEQKLQQFKQFVIQKEKEILQYLQKFKLQYQKEKFTIYRELLQENSFSVQADIVQLDQNFKNIASSFKDRFAKEKEISQEQFQDFWLKGQCLLQDSICQRSDDFINPISMHIQELNDKITVFEKQKEESAKKINELTVIVNENKDHFNQLVGLLNKESNKLDEVKQLLTTEMKNIDKKIDNSNTLAENNLQTILSKSDQVLQLVQKQPMLKQFISREMA